MSIVVDASVACKWLFEEEDGDRAEALLKDPELLAPELIFAEVGNIIWKRARSGAITSEGAVQAVEKLLALPFVLGDSRVLAVTAANIAIRFDRSFYDSLYVALAVARKTELVTADVRLVNALSGTELGRYIRAL